MRWRSEAIDFRLARMRSTRMDIGMTQPSQPGAGCTDGQAPSKAKGARMHVKVEQIARSIRCEWTLCDIARQATDGLLHHKCGKRR